MAILRAVLLLLPLAALAASPAAAFNITRILATHPEFSTFNHYLSATHLSTEINRRLTITVLALDNSAMSDLLSKHLTIYTLKNVLALHILTDYFGPKKLHQLSRRSTLVSSLFQATGRAPGITGFVNITNLRGGKVGLGAENNGLPARFVKSVHDVPYKISVLKIDTLLASPEAEAPMPPPPDFDLVEIMSKKGGCGMFARFAMADPDVNSTFSSCILGAGLTVFCPVDAAMIKFMPKWKNLTDKAKTALILYHSLDTYNSVQQLKAGSGHQRTIASDGKTYSFTVKAARGTSGAVNVLTKIVNATITGTVIDQQPLAIYSVNKVLQPQELFKVPEEEALPPGPAKKKGAKGIADGDYPDDGSGDDSSDGDEKNAAPRIDGGWRMVSQVGVMAAVAVLSLF